MRNATFVAALLFLSLHVTAAPSPVDTARRYLALVYEGRFDALPKTAQAETKKFEQEARNVLRVRCVRVDGMLVRESTADDAKATIVADVAIAKNERLAIAPLRFRLIREREQWLVSAVEFPDDEFAAQLLAASDEESNRLLAEHPERISASLARAVYERAIATFNSPGTNDVKEISRRVLRAAALTRRLAIASGDRGGEALAIGIESIDAGLERDDVASAARLGRESLAIAETLDDPDVRARAWFNLGRALHADMAARSRPERVDSLKRAAVFGEEAEDPRLLIRTLTTLANIAINEQSDLLAARRYIDRMMPLVRESGDVHGESDCEFNLSSIYIMQRDFERAKAHVQRGLKLERASGGRTYLTYLGRLAILLAQEGRMDEARAVIHQVIPLDQNGAPTWNGGLSRANASAMVEWLAGFAAEEGRMDEADCLYRSASVLRDPANPNFSLQDLSYDYLQKRNYAAALRSALVSFAETPERSPNMTVLVLTAIARAHRGLGDTNRALATVLEAIDVREAMNTRIAGDETQRASTSELSAYIYALAASIELDLHDPVRALTFVERGRARVLTDALEYGRPGAMKEAGASDQEERTRRERELVRLSVDGDRARAAGDGKAAARLAAQLDDARVDYATFIDGVRARSERRAMARRHVDGDALAAQLPAGVAAIEYVVDDDETHIFVVRRGAPVVCRTVHIATKALEERVNRFVEMLSSRDLEIRRPARELYDLLLRPVADDTAGAEALLVVPDRILWRVPFAALIDRQGRFLVEQTAVVYAPSITAYLMMSRERSGRRPASALFAVANPTIDAGAANTFTSFYRGATIGPLPDAEREVDAVRDLYDRAHSLVLTRDQATESRTKSAMGGAAVVHFATHGLLDDVNPMYSRLALAHDAAPSEDGWLESWEIARMKLDADIVVLSACETARGRIGGGEGVVGMAWSFFLAGARSTVATQWKIASSSTATFMTAFHRSLRSDKHPPALRKANALRDAQLALLHGKRFDHPFYWAAFVLLGDPAGSADRSGGPPAEKDDDRAGEAESRSD